MKTLTFFATIFMFLAPMLSTCSGENAEPSAVTDNANTTTTTTTTINVHFVDSAPDMFILENNGTCDLSESYFFIDFSNTAGHLYFDTDPSDGSHMSAPFTAVHGQIALAESSVYDGDESLIMRIAELGAGESAVFTIDVDGFDDYRVAADHLDGGVIGIITAEDDALHRTTFANSSTASLSVNCTE